MTAFQVTPSQEPPATVRAEAVARGWTPTGQTFLAASGVLYWIMTNGWRLGYCKARHRFVAFNDAGKEVP